MGLGLHLQIVNTADGDDTQPSERTCSFPAQLGRHELCNVHLDYKFVSIHHATIDQSNGALFVTDHSSRNGVVLLNGEYASPEKPVNLGESDNTFSIGSLRITVRMIEVDEVSLPNTQISTITGKLLETRRVEGAERLAQTAELSALAEELRPFVDAHQTTGSALHQRIVERVTNLNPAVRPAVLDHIAHMYPSLVHEPEFRRLAEHLGLVSLPGGERREAARALDCLRELSDFFLGQRPHTIDEIDGFCTKLRTALEQFVLVFLPVRNAFYRPESGIGGLGETRDPGLGSVTTPREVAAELLDWKRPGNQAQALRDIFASMIRHHGSLLSAVPRGVGAIVDGLAPASIESAIRQQRHRAPRRFSFGPWRQRWDEFALRHSEIPKDEEALLQWLFGPALVQARRALAEEAQNAQGQPSQPNSAVKASGNHTASPRSGPKGTVVLAQAMTSPPPPDARANHDLELRPARKG